MDQSGAWHPAVRLPARRRRDARGDRQRHAAPRRRRRGELRHGDGRDAVGNGVTSRSAAPPSGREHLVGAPEARARVLRHRARCAPRSVYAQIVDVDRDIVLGGQVDADPAQLDEQQHTIERSLEPLAYALSPSSSLKLEIVPATNVYGNQRATGTRRAEARRGDAAARAGPGRVGAGPDPGRSPAAGVRAVFTPTSVKRRTTAACACGRAFAAARSGSTAGEDLGRAAPLDAAARAKSDDPRLASRQTAPRPLPPRGPQVGSRADRARSAQAQPERVARERLPDDRQRALLPAGGRSNGSFTPTGRVPPKPSPERSSLRLAKRPRRSRSENLPLQLRTGQVRVEPASRR